MFLELIKLKIISERFFARKFAKSLKIAFFVQKLFFMFFFEKNFLLKKFPNEQKFFFSEEMIDLTEILTKRL